MDNKKHWMLGLFDKFHREYHKKEAVWRSNTKEKTVGLCLLRCEVCCEYVRACKENFLIGCVLLFIVSLCPTVAPSVRLLVYGRMMYCFDINANMCIPKDEWS